MSSASVTWLGHATALVSLGGQRLLVDPLGRRRCRSVAGQYDAVLITHAHVDHLNRWTLKKLDRDAQLLVPKGSAHLVSDLGFARVREVEPGDQLAVGAVDIIGVPTKHDRGRWRKGDRPDCTGYIFAHDGHVIHHAGDVDMSTFEIFDEIGRDFAIDATLLPIGGMLPTWYYRWRRKALDRGIHIDPDTALGIAERLGASKLVPVHWGTVDLRLGQLSGAPRKRLLNVADQQGRTHLVHLLRHGETLSLSAEMKSENTDDAHDGDGNSDEGAEDLVLGGASLAPKAPQAK